MLSLDFIFTQIEKAGFLASLILITIGFILGFAAAKAWFNKQKQDLISREEALRKKVEALKELDEIAHLLFKFKANPEIKFENKPMSEALKTTNSDGEDKGSNLV